MIAERLALELDVAALRAEYEAITERPVLRNAGGYGGWSVWSATGDHRDGWTDYSPVAEPAVSAVSEVQRGEFPAGADRSALGWSRPERWLGWRPEREYVVPTALCRGAFAELLTTIQGLGLEIARVRIAVLRAGHELAFHQEASPNLYYCRLHVPIVTNPGCFFVTASEREHWPADGGAYIVAVNQRHKAINHGRVDRAHLLMTVWDRVGVSQHHRLSEASACR